MFGKKYDIVVQRLAEYHKCVKYFHRGCNELAKAFNEAGVHMEYLGHWVHREGNRIGVLFDDGYDHRYISVPIYTFVSGRYADFVNKYCKLDRDE